MFSSRFVNKTKPLILVLLLLPSFIWVGMFVNGNLGINPIEMLMHKFGEMALRLLIGVLFISSLAQFSFLRSLQNLRRLIGLTAFYYVSLHLITYVFLDHFFNFSFILKDIYKKLNPDASEKKLVFVGRIATGIVVITGILWIPLMQVISSGGLYKYLQSVQAYIAPPIAAVFLLGIFWSRINASGALAALIGGFSAGMVRLGLEIKKASLSEGILLDIAELNFLYFAIFSFLSSVAVMIVVSILTPPPDLERLKGLTFSTTLENDQEISKNSWDNSDVIHSVVIITILALILIYFSPIGIGG
mgnify:CR=1 FL=1